MDPTVQPSYTYGQISAALFIGCSALLIIGLQPLLFGALVEMARFRWRASALSRWAKSPRWGLGLLSAMCSCPSRITDRSLSWRHSSASSSISRQQEPSARVNSSRCDQGAGLAEGVLVWGGSNVIVRAAKADWLAAIFMLLQALTQAAMAGVLSVLVMPRGGWAAGFEGLAIVSALERDRGIRLAAAACFGERSRV